MVDPVTPVHHSLDPRHARAAGLGVGEAQEWAPVRGGRGNSICLALRLINQIHSRDNNLIMEQELRK